MEGILGVQRGKAVSESSVAVLLLFVLAAKKTERIAWQETKGDNRYANR